jgi:hypothetical protein
MVLVLVFVAAVASIVWAGFLEPNSPARNLLNTAWILAPYLVLTTVAVIIERRTSLLATAVATLLGGCGALTSVGLMTFFEGSDDRFIPLYQAAAIAVLVPAYRWLMTRIDVRPPTE